METKKPNVLIVEDDPYIALETQSVVEECNCVVVGPASDIASAMSLVGTPDLSGALLDVNLGHEFVWPIADALDERHVPYILVSGFGRADLPQRFANRPFLPKPVLQKAVHRELAAIGLCVSYSSLP